MLSVLETERLCIRPLCIEDLSAIDRLYTDIAWSDPNASAEANLARRRSWIEWSIRNYEELAQLRQPPYGDRAVVLKGTGQIAGLVGLAPLLAPFAQLPSMGSREHAHYSAEVGLFWAISPSMQRKGYASEAARALVQYAFGHLKLARIVAGTEHANVGSIAVMRRLGMRIERNPFPEPAWFQTAGILDER